MPTRMKSLARKCMTGPKLSLDVDPTTGVLSGPNKVQFASYLGTLARDKISILTPSWKDVPQATKDLIWQDILVFPLTLHDLRISYFFNLL